MWRIILTEVFFSAAGKLRAVAACNERDIDRGPATQRSPIRLIRVDLFNQFVIYFRWKLVDDCE